MTGYEDWLRNQRLRDEEGYFDLTPNEDGQYSLRQRNALLKKGLAAAKNQLFAWDVRLSELGGQIANARIDLVKKINASAAKIYSELAKEKTKLKLGYKSSITTPDYGSQMLKLLEAKAELDSLRGFTSVGPHRDDIGFTLGGMDVGTYGSRGQQRLAQTGAGRAGAADHSGGNRIGRRVGLGRSHRGREPVLQRGVDRVGVADPAELRRAARARSLPRHVGLAAVPHRQRLRGQRQRLRAGWGDPRGRRRCRSRRPPASRRASSRPITRTPERICSPSPARPSGTPSPIRPARRAERDRPA